MKLVNLTCPNCSGSLKQEGEKLICQSCGAAFAIDYDDADVEHEKMATEEERAERELQHQKELLAEKHKLEEESRLAAEKRAKSAETKKNISKWAIGKVRSLIGLAIFALFIFGCYKCYRYFADDPSRLEKFTGQTFPTEATTKAPPTQEEILDAISQDFLDNVSATVLAKEREYRGTDVVTEFGSGWETEEYHVENIEFVYCYLMYDGEDNKLYCVDRLTYVCGDKTQYVFNAWSLGDIRLTDTGVLCDFKARSVTDGDKNYHWVGWLDEEDMYRQIILGNSDKYTATKIDPVLNGGVMLDSTGGADATAGSDSGET